jgi:hypothetical protein
MKWAGHITRMGEDWGAFQILTSKPGKRPQESPRMDLIRHY